MATDTASDAEREPRAVAVCILKGGMGKTTTSLNLARELAHRNERALLVDLDDNGHLTQSLAPDGVYDGPDNAVEEVLVDGADVQDYIVNAVDGLDLFPSHENLENVVTRLKNVQMGTTRVKKNIVDPLLGTEYDYIVIDCPANRGKLNDNAMYATGNLIIPLRPETGYQTGLSNTVKRLVLEAREYFDLDILAVHPTDLDDRLDQARRDRELLEEINGRERIVQMVPNFARITPEMWDEIDAGTYDGELPGIRYRKAIDDASEMGLPVRDFAPDCDQLAAYGELAAIVEQGGVVRAPEKQVAAAEAGD